MIVDDVAENGPALATGGLYLRAMHEIRDPQVIRIRHLVLGARPLGPTHGLVEPAYLEESPQCRLADPHTLRQNTVLMQDLMEELDRECAVLHPVPGDDLGGIVVQLTETALVRTRLRQECVEAAPLVRAQPRSKRRNTEAL